MTFTSCRYSHSCSLFLRSRCIDLLRRSLSIHFPDVRVRPFANRDAFSFARLGERRHFRTTSTRWIWTFTEKWEKLPKAISDSEDSDLFLIKCACPCRSICMDSRRPVPVRDSNWRHVPKTSIIDKHGEMRHEIQERERETQKWHVWHSPCFQECNRWDFFSFHSSFLCANIWSLSSSFLFFLCRWNRIQD